ncbi:MAG: nucleoside-diphosphate kinase [Candidatus Poribacteria bacterium]|jgi:nucleoside-diphosphate kinase|nr:nucleoside-diphosphate kinase [Candidatus Poribacteria bacterium]|tara:strand:- start:285 stop:698 length:414 start_codon:yes stop_codon:yes gene_type:complete
MEKTLVLIKPNGVQRGLVGQVLHRYERKGLKMTGLKLLHLSAEKAAQLYAPHQGKPFYQSLVDFMTSDPLVAVCLEGQNTIEIVRLINGATNPAESQPGTIRGDFSNHLTENVVHASDSVENAARELQILFDPGEIL